MKRLLALLLVMLMGASALAETTVLGYMSDGDYIHQYVAPNGQLLWFTAMEENPHIKLEDVNFDGAEDIVVFTILGASNFFTEFFLYDAQADMYVLATHPGQEHGICNYGLHPALGLVESQANNGSAGAEHEFRLYRWEGTKLKCIRSAVSETLTESSHSGNVYTTTTYHDKLHITVRNHELGDYDSALVWEKTITLDEAEYSSAYDEEMAAFWQDLK